MNTVIKTSIILLIATLSISSCSNTPQVKKDPGNSAQSQRSNAKQAQDELSRESSEK